jgi:TetR/AcrR family transcriptional regulator, repressor for neighboring sulfatase
MGAGRPRGRAEVVEALLKAARTLIAERGPASVTLREVADEAGVNFGLLYQYIGTKDQLLQLVYQQATEDHAARLAEVERLDSAIDLLMQSGDGSLARLIAWAALEGGEGPMIVGPSPAVRRLAELAQSNAEQLGQPIDPHEAQVFAALVMSITLGWRLFGGVSAVAASLETADQDQHTTTVRRMLERFARLITEPETPPSRSDAG